MIPINFQWISFHVFINDQEDNSEEDIQIVNVGFGKEVTGTSHWENKRRKHDRAEISCSIWMPTDFFEFSVKNQPTKLTHKKYMKLWEP